MKRRGKPIGKCVGCELNMRDHCAVFDSPTDQWARGHCKGYNDPRLIAQLSAPTQAQTGALASRERRQELFKLKHTEPHYQGVHARR